MDASELEFITVKLAGCSLDEHPNSSNWVERAGSLPPYICEVARAIKRSGHTTSQAIAIAVSRIKVWASGKGVDSDTQAKAVKALGQWEALRAKSHAKSAAKDVKASESSVDRIVRLSAEKPYGNVTYADPKNGKYPIDTEAHCRAAWSYVNMPKNADKYPLNGVTLSSVKSRIKSALKKYGVDVSE